MNTSLKWIKDLVPGLDCTPQEYMDAMTLSGSKVEGYENMDEDLDKIVIGQVKSIEKHPDADKLVICQVDIGKDALLQIVTGAPNVTEGAKVPVVLDGGRVAGGHDGSKTPGGIEIKNGKLRGVDSYGMMCSIEELGSNRDMFPDAPEYGLYIFDEDAPVGEDAVAYLGLDDSIIEYEITSNRVDCFSVLGIAREAAATFDKEFVPPVVIETGNSEDVNSIVKVTVKDADLCSRYTARVVKNIKFAPSPKWMQERLRSHGIRPINNIVDITNYVLKELGQPMHAFDYAYLEGDEINVRRADDGEKITTLDEKEFELNNSNLVICDGKKPVALAGIMGGLNSEIQDTTKEVMFEAAKFARDNIRKSSRALGQSSDSSAMYAKGVYEYTTVMAMKRALHLVEELGCGKVSSTHIEVSTGNSIEPKEMKVSVKRVNGVLGIEVPDADIVRILTALNFAPVINGDELTLQIPAYREDMDSYPDVAEEVIRMYGYEHVIPTFMPTAKVTLGGLNLKQKTELKIKRALCAAGAYEGIHYSFFSPSDLDLLRLPEDAKERHAIRLINPINIDLSLMRTTLAPQMIHAMARNQKKAILEGRIFELGNVFIPKDLPLTEYPDERETLCVGLFGEKESFYTLKGFAETVADALNITFTYEVAENTFLHPYQTAEIFCEGEKVGYLGKVSYEIMDELDMRVPAYVMEIDLASLKKWYGKEQIFTPLPKFAEEKRDFAFVVDKAITCAQIENGIKEACDYVTDVTLFDVYEGIQLGPDKKSMAFSVVFTPADEEFTTERVEGFVKKILKNLEKTLDIRLRA